MNNKLKKIQKEVEENYVLDKYKATLEMIKQCELGIQFLETQAGKDLQGEEKAKEGVLRYEETLRIKVAERDFFESLLK